MRTIITSKVWKRLFCACTSLCAGLALGVFAPTARAQVAGDVGVVSVLIRGVDIGWSDNYSGGVQLEMGVNALNGQQSVEASGGDQQTNQILARMVVGRTYFVTLNASMSLEGLVVQAIPPAGYVMEIEEVARERYDTPIVPYVSLRVRPANSMPPTRAGVATALAPNRVLWQASLGYLSTGDPAGVVAFVDRGSGSVMFHLSQSSLVYDRASSDVKVIPSPAGSPPYFPDAIRQIIAPQVCVDVVVEVVGSYSRTRLKFYHRAQLGMPTNGIYAFSGDPYASYSFDQDGEDVNAAIVTCELRNTTGTDGSGNPIVLPAGQSVAHTKVTKLVRSGSSPNYTWTAQDWFKSGETSVAETVRSRDGSAETLTVAPHGGNAIAQRTRTYSALPWGEEVTQETLGTGPTAIGTDYTYWDTSATSLGNQSPAHTRIRSRISHGSWEAWEYHQGGLDREGRLFRRHRPFKDSDTSVPANHPSIAASLSAHTGEVTTYEWEPDAFGRATRPTLIETKVNGIVTAKAEIAYSSPAWFGTWTGPETLTLITATRKDYSASGTYLTTTTKYFSEHSGTYGAPPTHDFFRLRLHSVQQPDGVKQSFAYQRGTWNGSAFTPSGNNGLDVPSGSYASRTFVITGVTSGGTLYTTHAGYDIDDLWLIDGKSTLAVTIRDTYARVVRTESYVRSAGDWHLLGAVNYRWNFANELIKRAANQSASYDLASGAIYEASYNGEHLTSETDESGIVTSYTYDVADRVETATQAAATGIAALATKFTYDAASRVTEQRVGWDNPQVPTNHQIVTSRSFDAAGRLGSQTQPGPNGGMTTSFSYSPTIRQVTVSLPNGGSRTDTYHADGSLKEITGSAVVPEYLTYDVLSSTGQRYSRVNIGSSSSTRLRETWSDWLGRATQTSRPGFTGQPDFVEGRIFHGSTGQLTKSTRTGYANTLYQYDAFGQLARTGLDLNGNDTLELSSSERIGDSDTSFQYVNNAWWMVQVAKVYPTANNGTPLTVSTTRVRLTGFTGNLRAQTVTIDLNGVTTTRSVSVDRANKTTTITTATTGLTNAQTETYVNGLPTSVTRFDGLTYTTGYDALLRPATSVDPRTGTTTTTYKNGSTFVYRVHDPAHPAATYAATYAYDNAGRVIAVQDAYGKVTRTEYNARDQVVRRWGNASHPVEFGYTPPAGQVDFGERTTMRTFRGGSGWEGVDGSGNLLPWPSGTTGTGDWTRWEYDAPSGLMKAKYDAANLNSSGNPITNAKKIAYTYNSRGQPSQRTWARGVVTTYSYDSNTGELASQTYSDGTPAVSYTYTRAGQLGTVTDHTGTRTLAYGTATGSHSLQLDTISLPAYYGSRVLTRNYDSIHRPSGFLLGNTGSPSADLAQSHTYHATSGRFSEISNQASQIAAATRTFSYGYNTGGLVSTLSDGGSFYVAYGYEPNRDLLTTIDSKWGGSNGASRTRYDYVYNKLGQRYTAKQSGDAFDDFGGSTYYRHVYNDRGELIGSADYLGETPIPLDANQQTVDGYAQHQLPGRNFVFAYDNSGNRQTTSRSGPSAGAETYSLADTTDAKGALNQYSSRTNAWAHAAGTVSASTTSIAASGGSLPWSVGPKGRFWAANTQLSGSNPSAFSLTFTATIAGGGSNGANLVRTETRTAYFPPALQSFTYDLDGNLTGDGLWTYVYDAENRLVQMLTTVPAVNAGFPNRTLEFKYDYLGRRVQKRSLNQTTGTDTYRRYLYDGWNLVAEFEVTSLSPLTLTLTRSYTWGLDLAGSLSAIGGVGALLQITDHPSSIAYLPTYDGNGNVAALLRASDGVAVAKYEYSPFGELLRCWEPEVGGYAKQNPFRFSTKFIDDESGLVYYGARFYSPSLGRFVNRDPMGEAGGLNLYGFCGNDGVNQVDVLGMVPAWVQSAWDWLTGKNTSPNEGGKPGPKEGSNGSPNEGGTVVVPPDDYNPGPRGDIVLTSPGRSVNNPQVPYGSPSVPGVVAKGADPDSAANPLSAVIARNRALAAEVGASDDYERQIRSADGLRNVVLTGTQLAADANPVIAVAQIIQGRSVTGDDYDTADYILGAIAIVPLGKALPALRQGTRAVRALKPVAEIAALGHRYRVPTDPAKLQKIRELTRAIYDKYLPRIRSKRSGPPKISREDPNRVVHGLAFPADKSVGLYPGSNQATLLEELIHIKQIVEGGYEGLPAAAIPPAVRDRWEREVHDTLIGLGFELLK